MAGSKSSVKSKASKPNTSSRGVTLDVVFSGPLLFVPQVQKRNVLSVEVYSPRNGHPIGAVFLPKRYFTDQELENPSAETWPTPEVFSLLDSHSYAMELEQVGSSKSFQVESIPETNHKVKSGRRLSHEWEIALSLGGELSRWTSHRLFTIQEGMFGGSDAPQGGSSVANLHRLTYEGVKAIHLHGVSKQQQDYLKSNTGKGGTLVVVGEIPYQSSLLHERRAVDAMAKLAGLDLHLLSAEPLTVGSRVTGHVAPCGFSTIIA